MGSGEQRPHSPGLWAESSLPVSLIYLVQYEKKIKQLSVIFVIWEILLEKEVQVAS